MRIFYSHTYCETDVTSDTTRKAYHLYQSLRERPINGVELLEPRSATESQLAHVHSPRYLRALRTGVPYELAASNGLGWDSSFYGAVRSSTGGVRDAALAALDDGVSGSLSSGLHHANRECGRGFCTLNGLALAADAVIATGAERVLILDLDAHCGGGTADIIRTVPGVEQVDVSVVEFDSYDTTGREDLTLVIAGSDDYLDSISTALRSVRDPQSIDLVLFNAGMDPHEAAGGIPGITAETLASREAMVFSWATHLRLPIAFVLAGGYTSPLFKMDALVELHRLTISAAAEAATVARGARWN